MFENLGAEAPYFGPGYAEVCGASLVQSASSTAFREVIAEHRQRSKNPDDEEPPTPSSDGPLKMLCTVLAASVEAFGMHVLVTCVPPLHKTATKVLDPSEGMSKSATMRRIIEDTFVLSGIDELVSPSKAQVLGHSGFDGRYYIVGCADLLPRETLGTAEDPRPISDPSQRSGSVEIVLEELDGLASLPHDGGDVVNIMQKCGVPARYLGAIATKTRYPM